MRKALLVLCLVIASCHTKTVLDLESCAEKAVAQAAEGLLGTVAAGLLNGSDPEAVKQGLLDTAKAQGLPAGIGGIICAIDTVVNALGGSKQLPATATKAFHGQLSDVQIRRAIALGNQVRASLLK